MWNYVGYSYCDKEFSENVYRLQDTQCEDADGWTDGAINTQIFCHVVVGVLASVMPPLIDVRGTWKNEMQELPQHAFAKKDQKALSLLSQVWHLGMLI